MRRIEDHKVSPSPGQHDIIKIQVTDLPGAGGANHEYEVILPGGDITYINFQNGPVPDHGVNGLTQEVLIAICIDRLRNFQNGLYACRENALALTKLEEALLWLHSRTRGRLARGVEGTNTI